MTLKHSRDWANIDFRRHPIRYKIGRGEQGVLTAEPYKSEILPHWKFRTPAIARASAKKIFQMFETYLRKKDFVGADMARKYLQMGWTRARRYANHPSGTKYGARRKVLPQAKNALSSEKSKSAAIFFRYFKRAREDARYLKMKAEFIQDQAATKAF